VRSGPKSRSPAALELAEHGRTINPSDLSKALKPFVDEQIPGTAWAPRQMEQLVVRDVLLDADR